MRHVVVGSSHCVLIHLPCSLQICKQDKLTQHPSFFSLLPPHVQSIPMLYSGGDDGLHEGPTWGAWWTQNRSGGSETSLVSSLIAIIPLVLGLHGSASSLVPSLIAIIPLVSYHYVFSFHLIASYHIVLIPHACVPSSPHHASCSMSCDLTYAFFYVPTELTHQLF